MSPASADPLTSWIPKKSTVVINPTTNKKRLAARSARSFFLSLKGVRRPDASRRAAYIVTVTRFFLHRPAVAPAGAART
jgi:hypothetical protein